MSKEFELNKIKNLIDSFSNRIKTGIDALEARNIKNCLLETRETLHGHLETMYWHINTLNNDFSRKVKQTMSQEADKIKSLINETESTLNNCRQIMEISNEQTEIIKDVHDASRDNDSCPMKLSIITSETITILDTERYGTTTGHEMLVEYPKPDLGSSIQRRNCSISVKIRIGLGITGGKSSGNDQITMPKFYHQFNGEKI